jgi:hypothetical protein
MRRRLFLAMRFSKRDVRLSVGSAALSRHG